MNKDDILKLLDDFKNRRIYQELTLEILATIPDDKLEQALMDFLGTKITDYRTTLVDVSRLSPGVQMIYSTIVLETQVNNGGFNQFFYNPSGEFANMALRSFELLGAADYFEILRRALEIRELEKENSALQELYRQRTLLGFSESYKLTQLGDCDDAFYRLNDRLSELRIHYIRSHPEEFVGK